MNSCTKLSSSAEGPESSRMFSLRICSSRAVSRSRSSAMNWSPFSAALQLVCVSLMCNGPDRKQPKFENWTDGPDLPVITLFSRK